MKKVLYTALICTLMLLALSVTVSAATEGYYTYEVSNGEATITDVDTNISGDIIIPSTLGGYPVTAIGYQALGWCYNLTSVEIPDVIAKIDNYAFCYCKSLKRVVIGNGVITIGDYLFDDCYNLSSITISDNVVAIGHTAFDDTEWYRNQLDGLIYIGKVLYKYKGTMPENTTITIKDGTKGVAEQAFRDCTQLISIGIPDSVTAIGDYAFYNCDGLTSVVIPDSVTTIGGSAFEYCTKLTSVVIGDSVTTIGYSAFSYCENLENIEIPDNVTTIGGSAFEYCTKLTSVVIGDSVTTIGESAFCNCKGITSIEIPDSVTTIDEYAFGWCTELKNIKIGKHIDSIYEYAFVWCNIEQVYYKGNKTQWEEVYIQKGNDNLQNASIMFNAVKFVAYNIKNQLLIGPMYINAEESKYKYNDFFKEKEGYTLKISNNSELDALIQPSAYITEDSIIYVDYQINKYTYKFLNYDGVVIKKQTAEYGTVIKKPEDIPIKEETDKYIFSFKGWDNYAEGIKLSCDIEFIAVYETWYKQYIELERKKEIFVGELFYENICFATQEPVNYLICEIVYPDVLELNSITPRDFKYASQESLKNKDGLNYLTVICQYADDETTVPENTSINPFNLSFAVSKTAKPQEIEIKFGEDTYLSGEEDYPFENKINAKTEILPKLASSITITGNSIIYEPTKFTAEVYPDYTTDKTIEWSVDDETVATISKDGILTPVKNGEVTITATAVGGTYRTKTITVYRNAYVDGFKSDVGMWNEKILPDTKEYTIYVTEDTSVINITPLFTTGTLIYDDAIVIKNRPKEFELTEDETIITLARSDAGYLDCTYTIKVIKKPGLKNETIKVESFKKDCINILVYNNNAVRIEETEDITITISEKVSSYKILYWESLANLKPVYEPIIKEL